jgi:hypothetical protein
VIGAGTGFTVICLVATQPETGPAYSIVHIPAALPVTIPAASTDATVGLLLVHVPPKVVDDSAVVEPTHTVGVPEIVAGSAFTVTTPVTKQLLASL